MAARQAAQRARLASYCAGNVYEDLGEYPLAPKLLNIMRESLTQVEKRIASGDDEPAVIELRKRLAQSIGELEVVKAKRRSIAKKLFLVTPRNRTTLVDESLVDESAGEDTRTEAPRKSSGPARK